MVSVHSFLRVSGSLPIAPANLGYTLNMGQLGEGIKNQASAWFLFYFFGFGFFLMVPFRI